MKKLALDFVLFFSFSWFKYYLTRIANLVKWQHILSINTKFFKRMPVIIYYTDTAWIMCKNKKN